MKKSVIALALLLAGLLSGCKASQSLPERQNYEFSWAAFCDARGYDVADRSEEVCDEYLDTWRGSVEEDAALIAAGVEPF